MTAHILTRNYVVRVYTRRNDGLNSSLKVRGVTQTGDYSGLLKCQGFGEPPTTLAKYALNQLDNSDFFDISLVDGFNVPMEFSPTSAPTAQQAAPVIDIRNNCPFTVWAAAVPGGGQRLDYGGVWRIQTNSGRIWGRTNCNFGKSGKGHCQTGDCNGLLECKAYGTPPNTG
ncbi:Thaumatin-like protein [Capsicum annuum]|nr:Thaumatin-like protein [Capsicum annuum]KAF3685440.1 Thaumatin-like protein [Capsicum annuum]